MKKYLVFLLVTISFAVIAQEKKTLWDYPVNSKSKEWKNLKSIDEQFEAYNIPAGIIKNISTEELVKTCLSYPEWGLIHAYNDRQTGLSVIVSLFNGFQELFSRDDAAKELMKVYIKLDPLAVKSDWTALEQGQYAFRFNQIELLLMQRTMIAKLDDKGLLELNNIAISKYKSKKKLPKQYSLFDLSPTVGICLSIFEKENAYVTNIDPSMRLFRNSLMADDIGVLDRIVELSGKSKL
ncbi:MAG: hypothetical protein LBI58_01625 [Tannerellaceae bacterium]|jgi:hypothetical protein|nr:hypothetical protein [Tannerellaceae bacterium]